MDTGSSVRYTQCPRCKKHVRIPFGLLNTRNTSNPIITTGGVSVAPTITTTTRVPNYASHSYPISPVTIRPPINPPNHPLSEHEASWREKFWKLPVMIHGVIQIVFTALIIILEIASLAVLNYSATGVGIWCGIPFMTAAILTLLLVWKWDRSRVWATRVFIAQMVLIVFCFVLIGIVGDLVSKYGAAYSFIPDSNPTSFTTKYQIIRAQLAFGILLLFSGIAYIVFYCIVTYLALWKPYQTLDTPHLFKD